MQCVYFTNIRRYNYPNHVDEFYIYGYMVYEIMNAIFILNCDANYRLFKIDFK